MKRNAIIFSIFNFHPKTLLPPGNNVKREMLKKKGVEREVEEEKENVFVGFQIKKTQVSGKKKEKCESSEVVGGTGKRHPVG